MKLSILNLLFIFAFHFACGDENLWAARPDLIPSTDSTELRLGYGIDLITEEPKQLCVEWDNVGYEREDVAAGESASPNSTRNLGIKVEHITSYRQFDEFSHKSISANVSYKVYTGGYSYEGNSSSKMQSDQVIVGMQAFADYGRSYLKNPRLKPEYAKMLEVDPKRFYQLCGHEFIIGFKEGQGISLLMSTSSSVQQSYDYVSQKVSAGVGAAKFKGSVGASFLDIASALLKFGSLNVDVRIIGGSSLNTLSELISTDSDVKNFTNKIADIVKQLERSAAQRYVYISAPYPGQSEVESNLMVKIKKQTLRDLFADYRKLSDSLVRLRQIIRNSNSFVLPISGFANICQEYPKECKAYLKQLAEREKQLRMAIEKIDQQADICVKASKATECRGLSAHEINADEITQIEWPGQFKYFLYQQWLDDYAKFL